MCVSVCVCVNMFACVYVCKCVCVFVCVLRNYEQPYAIHCLLWAIDILACHFTVRNLTMMSQQTLVHLISCSNYE